jgi:protein involved in polysaccharide export with SLBB domain
MSQDFDREFLDSLPEDVREDLLAETERRKSLEEPIYRKPSTFVEKKEISARFGSDFFSSMQTTLMPINEPNFDSDYILDFGDVLQVQNIGSNAYSVEEAIKRDGSINLPDLGKVFIGGLSLADATNLVKNKVEESSIGSEAFVTLVNVRDVQVVLAGNVFNPGSYTLSGNSNIFHALTISGGPSEFGSFREIDLIRQNKVIETIDLYKIFISGEGNFGSRLRSGDLVFVRPAKKIIGIYGGVKRPGVYELKDNESFSNLLFFANGFRPDADKKNINYNSIIESKVVSSRVTGYESLEEIIPQDGNSLYVGIISIKEVEISGSVKNPGRYSMNPGDGIYELILRAGGYDDNAYPFGGVLLNENVKKVNAQANDQLYKDLLETMVDNSIDLSQEGSGMIGSLLQEFRATPPTGRITTSFDLDLISKDPSKNTLLQDGDIAIIPEAVNYLYVFGETANEGTVLFSEGRNIDYYLSAKGGLNDSADSSSIFVLFPDGTSKRISSKNIFRDGSRSVELYPGSVIFVPKKHNNMFRANIIQSYAAILGNLGVSLASLSVIKN